MAHGRGLNLARTARSSMGLTNSRATLRDEPCVMLESFAVWKRALMRHGHHPDYAFDGLSIIVR